LRKRKDIVYYAKIYILHIVLSNHKVYAANIRQLVYRTQEKVFKLKINFQTVLVSDICAAEWTKLQVHWRASRNGL